MWRRKWEQPKTVIGESPRFNVLEYFPARLFPPSCFCLPLFTSFSSVCDFRLPTFHIDFQLFLNTTDSIRQIVLRQFALPYNDNAPSERFKESIILQIPFSVVLNLRQPEFLIGFRKYKLRASFVPVPKAAVHEYATAVFGKNDIRFSGKILYVEAVLSDEGTYSFNEDEYFVVEPTYSIVYTNEKGFSLWYNFKYDTE